MDIGELERKFISPEQEFTPYPFWFWNDELDEKEIGRQMREFQSKGVEGVIIHPRLGLSEKIGYLTEKWFYFVRYAAELARRLEMKVMLYDEAMYPSGSCHGQVVRENPAFASVGLIRQEIVGEEAEEAPENTVAFFSTRGKRCRFVTAPSGGTIRGCFAGEDDGAGGAPKSADLLNPEAVESFIRNTHERYYRHLREYFGCCSTPENPYTLSKADMKWYLDWLFVRGVNMIIPHAFYYSMRGERKDERPPEVGIHCGYWEEYSQISAYIKRMSWLMTDCVNKARVAVLCGWQTLSWELARPLYENQIEFNYLEEELLGSVSVEKGGIRIAKQFYMVILTDKTHCEETENLLQDWEQKGVRVVRCPSGAVPIKAVRDGAGQDLELESACPDLRKTHIVKEGISFFFLTNEGEKTVYVTATVREGRIGQIWDPWTGAIQRMEKKSPRAQLALGARESKILVVFQD